MDTVFQLAQAWLEHCREEAEFYDSEGEDDTAEKWHRDANEAERILKRDIDGPHVPNAAGSIRAALYEVQNGDLDEAEAALRRALVSLREPEDDPCA